MKKITLNLEPVQMWKMLASDLANLTGLTESLSDVPNWQYELTLLRQTTTQLATCLLSIGVPPSKPLTVGEDPRNFTGTEIPLKDVVDFNLVMKKILQNKNFRNAIDTAFEENPPTNWNNWQPTSPQPTNANLE